jgi:MoxR-like ATPase
MKKYKVVYKEYSRPLFTFNCGGSQDARSTFIGNTFFSKESGTWFNKSEFVKAIETPNAIILLDELSRLTHDGANILIPVLDPTQRTLRLDESENNIVIKAAQGVTFLATANVGNEYTATKVMDKALTSRFSTIIEMDPLEYEQEMELLKIIYPSLYEKKLAELETLCHISSDIKAQCRMEDSKITTFIPTGTVIEMADLVSDGFNLQEIVDMVILPVYSNDGGTDSERLFIKQIVEKYLNVKSAKAKNPITPGKKKEFF